MKHLAAIFLISVFAFSQYAKQFAYMECKISNSIGPTAQKCDCEKKYDLRTNKEKIPLPAQTHFQSAVDELYTAPQNKFTAENLFLSPQKLNILFSHSLPDGNHSTPFRPPQI